MAKTFSKLTRVAMRKLVLGAKISEHGIIFERQANGDGVFSVNVMVDAQRIHRVIGRESDGTTRTQTEEFIEKARQDAKAGRLNLPKGRKIAMGFSEAVDNYLIKLEQEGGKDLKMKRARLRLHISPFFGNLPLSKISSFDVERYKKHRLLEYAIRGGIKQKPRDTTKLKTTSPGTINRELAALSHLLSKAIEWGWIDRRPATIRRYQEERSRVTYLTIEQIERLTECAKQDQNPQIYPFVVIGLGTSMRRMEILSIRRDNVNLEHRTIYIPDAKGGPREQPITGQLVAFLEGHMAASQRGAPWLFPSPTAKHGHTVDIRKPFRRVVSAAGLNPDEVVRHTLRHTAITHLVQAGVDLPTVKRISGHKTLIMVERYAHQNGEHINSAMDKLEGRYRKIR
ncbi:tyrosine-type recombinase/integrase [Nitrosospira sp. Is2]|uniref:tyrosine-type recombinase/integrase n=1 Tax=Nitrosospira sp. Is2 TaxID=3080532 RepID=UPI00295333EF|nr:tyrosine-type recombinase/integrase [Nitrosospira sp. Is2]WON75156.1 tyrosine-type recombinase/integrase [Nitrosospira sp. Is2]